MGKSSNKPRHRCGNSNSPSPASKDAVRTSEQALESLAQQAGGVLQHGEELLANSELTKHAGELTKNVGEKMEALERTLLPVGEWKTPKVSSAHPFVYSLSVMFICL